MFKNSKLAPKLAFAIGVCSVIVFTILIIVTAVMSGRAINNAVSGELTAVSQANGQQVQQIFDAAGTVVEDIQSYLLRANRIAKEDPVQMQMPATEEAARMNQSEIYGCTLTSLNYDVELYIRESARNTAANNADIAGVGVMFEPYAFQQDIRDFAFYVAEGKADENVTPYGAYESYANESYYHDASASRQSVVTEPFDNEGIRMVTYAAPILADDKLQGVVMADIALTNFDKINSTSERYPSMYATIYDDKQMVIYDSEDAADIGHYLNEFMPNADELAAVQASMTQGFSDDDYARGWPEGHSFLHANCSGQ